VFAVRTGEKGLVKRIGNLISPLVAGLGLEEAVRFEQIRKEWSDIFREPLSLHMFPCSLKHGELLITVDSPVWHQQLIFLKSEILKHVSPYGVKDVRFRIGKVQTKTKEMSRPPQQKAPSLDRVSLQQIEETVSELKDGPVKESIRKTMEKSLSARKVKS
jgi:hypothetical protein